MDPGLVWGGYMNGSYFLQVGGSGGTYILVRDVYDELGFIAPIGIAINPSLSL